MVQKSSNPDDVIVVKKYANRRLYNTATSSYVTLDTLCEMVKEGKEFVVKDAKSGKDITRSVLTQIIFEEEGKGQNLLPIRFLRQLIGFYGGSLQAFVPSYLDMSMDTFAREQERLKDRVATAFGGRERFDQIEEQVRQNFSMFENALRMFSPFGARQAAGDTARKQTEKGPAKAPGGGEQQDDIDALKKQVASMQARLDALSAKKKKSG